jgi:hypothetical protein
MSRKTVIRELREARTALQSEVDNHLIFGLEGIRNALRGLARFTFSKIGIQDKLRERLEGMGKELSLYRMYLKLLMDGMAEKQKQLEAEEEAENGTGPVGGDPTHTGSVDSVSKGEVRKTERPAPITDSGGYPECDDGKSEVLPGEVLGEPSSSDW